MKLLDYIRHRLYYLSARRGKETVVVTEHGFLGMVFYDESSRARLRNEVRAKLNRRPQAAEVTYCPLTKRTEVVNPGVRHIPFIPRV